MLGILPYAGLDIAAFELMHDRLQLAYCDPAAVPPAALLVAGMLSSTGAQLVAYPLGFVRTRLQARARSCAHSPAPRPLPPWRTCVVMTRAREHCRLGGQRGTPCVCSSRARCACSSARERPRARRWTAATARRASTAA